MRDRKKLDLAATFGNLKVRPKLMVLHNLFFLVLTCAAYFSLIPLFERLVADARARELSIVQQTARIPPTGALAPPAGNRNPAAENQVPGTGTETRLTQRSYQEAVARAKLTLFLVLGSIYVLAVLLLESAIMPLYVYLSLIHI